MKHYGDITKLSGYGLPPVDCITGGSPCQDLSQAGKRAGLAGERSGLFMEQVRIVKEMREHDREQGRPAEFVRPRYMVWENVPGALSSNGGADFQAVLTEIVRIAEPDADDVPMPEKKWPNAGCLYDEMGRWSVAWRIHDAQFWGVPQRRKRIALVADFAGLSAPEVLFERKGLSGDFEQSEPERKGTAERTERSAGETSKTFGIGGVNSKAWTDGNPHSGIYEAEISRTLDLTGGSPACNQGGMAIVAKQPICVEMTSTKNTIVEDGIVPTLTARMGTGGNQVNAVMEKRNETACKMTSTKVSSVDCRNGTENTEDTENIRCFQNTGHGWWNESEIAATVRTPGGGDSTKANLVAAVDCRNGTENTEVNGTLQSKNTGGSSVNYNNIVREIR